MPDVSIVSVRQVADPHPNRAGQPATWVQYKVGPAGGLRSIFLPSANPSNTEMETAIREDLRRATAAEGHSFTV